jgi:hypothetical protein
MRASLSSIIEQACLPTERELARARETVERVEDVLGAATLDVGEFIDAAMLGAARQIVAIAEHYGLDALFFVHDVRVPVAFVAAQGGCSRQPRVWPVDTAAGKSDSPGHWRQPPKGRVR